MQARSSVDGTLKHWVRPDAPDYAGAFFPGPGTPQNLVAFSGVPIEGEDPLRPHRMPLDANVLCRWKFTETSAPFVNDGTRGTAQNMVASAGEGTVFRGGRPDGWFDRGLNISMATNVGNVAIRAPHFAWPSSQITISAWFTPTRKVSPGPVSGRLFFKAHTDASWASPFYRHVLSYGTDNVWFQGPRKSDGVFIPATPHNFPVNRDVQLLKIHHVGYTFGDGQLRSYLDGELYQTTSDNTDVATNLGTGSWCIGRPPTTAFDEYLGGIIHEIRLCQVVRPATWWRETWLRGTGKWMGA